MKGTEYLFTVALTNLKVSWSGFVVFLVVDLLLKIATLR